ncbi:hypothetical protein F4U94_17105 [Sphingobium limneticum]|nr:hypothetical protein F4U94_17105 [Sphingobium limneticum]
MTSQPHSVRISWKGMISQLVRRYLWGMDIAPGAHIAGSALIDRTWPKGVHIAEGCVFAEESVLLTHDMARGVYLDTRVGAGTRVGPRAIIMPGVTIGADCVIEPGAVVTKDMPSRSRAIGNPASINPA